MCIFRVCVVVVVVGSLKNCSVSHVSRAHHHTLVTLCARTHTRADHHKFALITKIRTYLHYNNNYWGFSRTLLQVILHLVGCMWRACTPYGLWLKAVWNESKECGQKKYEILQPKMAHFSNLPSDKCVCENNKSRSRQDDGRPPCQCECRTQQFTAHMD